MTSVLASRIIGQSEVHDVLPGASSHEFCGKTILITGCSASGKTTLCEAIINLLRGATMYPIVVSGIYEDIEIHANSVGTIIKQIIKLREDNLLCTIIISSNVYNAALLKFLRDDIFDKVIFTDNHVIKCITENMSLCDKWYWHMKESVNGHQKIMLDMEARNVYYIRAVI